MTLTSILAQQLVNGLVLGSFYALVALGYTMVFGVVKLLNFAHGDLYMTGAFAGFLVFSAIAGIVGMVLIIPIIGIISRTWRTVGCAGVVVRIRVPVAIGRGDAAGEDEVAGEPATTVSFAEHVVAHTVAGRRRVDDPVVANVDRDVGDVIAVVREEKQVSRP